MLLRELLGYGCEVAIEVQVEWGVDREVNKMPDLLDLVGSSRTSCGSLGKV